MSRYRPIVDYYNNINEINKTFNFYEYPRYYIGEKVHTRKVNGMFTIKSFSKSRVYLYTSAREKTHTLYKEFKVHISALIKSKHISNNKFLNLPQKW